MSASVDDLRQSGALIFVDLPEGTEFGLDYRSFRTGPRFKGVKLIPAGTHYVFFSASGKFGDSAPRTSFFLEIHPGQVHVFQWNEAAEDLMDVEDMDPSLIRQMEVRYRSMQLDGELAAYDEKSWPEWQLLRSHINAEVLDKLSPVGGRIFSAGAKDANQIDAAEEETEREIEAARQKLAAEFPDLFPPSSASSSSAPVASSSLKIEEIIEDEAQSLAASSSSSVHEEDMPPALEPIVEEPSLQSAGQPQESEHKDQKKILRRTPYFSSIPQRKPKASSALSPSELTAMQLDKSWALEQVLAIEYSGNESALLGEFQYSFVTFLLGQSMVALTQWKSLVLLLCECDAAMHTRPRLFIDFIRIFTFQLAQVPEDFFSDPISTGNFLDAAFKSLFELAADESLAPELIRNTQELQQMVSKRFGWKYSMDPREMPEEDAPVIVDENEEYF